MKVTVRSNTDAIVRDLSARIDRGAKDLGFVAGKALELTADLVQKRAFVGKGERIPAKDVYFGKTRRGAPIPYSKRLPVERTGRTRREFEVVAGARHQKSYELHIGDGQVRGTVQNDSGKIRALLRSNSVKLSALENVPNKGDGKKRRFINKQWAFVLRNLRKSIEQAFGNAVGAK